MAQQFPISAQAIYGTLSADTTFMGYLGTYEFTAGQTLPAISVISAGEDLPSLRNVQGVECVILDAGNTTQFDYLTDEAPRQSTMWTIFLVCWEPATGGMLQQATERAMANFLGAQSVQTVATSDGLGSLVQNKIMIRSDMPIRNLDRLPVENGIDGGDFTSGQTGTFVACGLDGGDFTS